jgi:hypothetical protein
VLFKPTIEEKAAMRLDAQNEEAGFTAELTLRLLMAGAAMLGLLLWGSAQATDTATPKAPGQSARTAKNKPFSPSDRFCGRVATDFDQQRLTVLLDSQRSADPLPIDINGDGSNEHVWFESFDDNSGSRLGIENAATGKEISLTYPDDFVNLLATDASLIRIAGRTFILARAGNDLYALFHLDAQFTYLPACSFRQIGSGKSRSNIALSAYEIILARSKGRHIRPYEYAIDRKNVEEVKLLAAHGHDINGRGKSDSTADLPLGYAVWKLDDDATGRELIHEMLRLGADPIRRDQTITPLETAVSQNKPGFASMLMQHSRDVSSLLPYYIVDRIKDKEAAGTLLAVFSRKRGEVDWDVLKFILDQRDMKLLKTLAQSHIPLSASEKYWRDGIPSTLPPYLADRVAELTDEKMKLLFLSFTRAEPATGVQIHLDAQYNTVQREYSLSAANGVHAAPRYSPQAVQEFLNFSTSICVHLVGQNCGPAALQKQASEWLARLPDNCSDELRKVYDSVVCKLALYYAEEKNKKPIEPEIFMRNKLDPNDKLYFQESIQRLGTRSLLNNTTKIQQR